MKKIFLYYNKLEGDKLNIINNLATKATTLIADGGIIFGFLLVLAESFIPALPLGVFIALNINAFGFLLGIILSWIATSLGCFLAYLFFYYLSNNVVFKIVKNKTKAKIEKAIKKFEKISLSNLVVLMILPFIPAFLINILAGVSGINQKKFLIALLIGKIFMVTFWGYVGKSLIEKITDINSIILITSMIIVAYILSKIIGKKMNIE